MRKATERYNTKVEIPICIILDTIFNSYNNDVELLCRQALKYGFVDFDDKTKKYVLQKDYKEQDIYTVLDKEERKQYNLENELIEKGKKLEKEYRYLQQENKQLNSILTELEEWLKAVYEDYDDWKDEYRYSTYITAINETFDKIQELKEKYK